MSLSRKTKLSPVVFCGPSGCGKSTLIKELTAAYPNCFGFSVSHTTRKPRHGEENGVHYHFVSHDDMKAAIERDEFVEFAEYAGNFYGTSKPSIEEVQIRGHICFLDVNGQGVANIKKTDLNPVCIFIKPPNVETLEQRLRDRGTESEGKILQRLSAVQKELKFGEKKDMFDKVIVNDDLKVAVKELKEFLKDLIDQVQHPT